VAAPITSNAAVTPTHPVVVTHSAGLQQACKVSAASMPAPQEVDLERLLQRAITQAVGQARSLVDRERQQRETTMQKLENMVAELTSACQNPEVLDAMVQAHQNHHRAPAEGAKQSEDAEERMRAVEGSLQNLAVQLRSELGEQRQRIAMLEEHLEFQKAFWDERLQQLSNYFVNEIGQSYKEMSSFVADKEAGLQRNVDHLKDQVQKCSLHIRGVSDSLDGDVSFLPEAAVPPSIKVSPAPLADVAGVVVASRPSSEIVVKELTVDHDGSSIQNQMRALQGAVSGLSAELATSSTRLAVDILGARAESSRAFYLANDAFQTARRLLQVVVGDDVQSWRARAVDGPLLVMDREVASATGTSPSQAPSPVVPPAPPSSLRRMHSCQSFRSSSVSVSTHG